MPISTGNCSPGSGRAASAFGELFTRHADAVRRFALRHVREHAEADDLDAEAFFRVLQAIRRGNGPTEHVRTYLLTVARRVAWEWNGRRRDVPVEDEELSLRVEPFPDVTANRPEHTLISRAFTSLPERWRTVLWQVEVEGERPAAVAPSFGLSPNAMAALARRAREGLRAAYLQAHLAEDAGSRRAVRWSPSSASTRRRRAGHRAPAHAQAPGTCSSCNALHAELVEVCATCGGARRASPSGGRPHWRLGAGPDGVGPDGTGSDGVGSTALGAGRRPRGSPDAGEAGVGGDRLGRGMGAVRGARRHVHRRARPGTGPVRPGRRAPAKRAGAVLNHATTTVTPGATARDLAGPRRNIVQTEGRCQCGVRAAPTATKTVASRRGWSSPARPRHRTALPGRDRDVPAPVGRVRDATRRCWSPDHGSRRGAPPHKHPDGAPPTDRDAVPDAGRPRVPMRSGFHPREWRPCR